MVVMSHTTESEPIESPCRTAVSCSWHKQQSEWRRVRPRDPQHSGCRVSGVFDQSCKGLLWMGCAPWGRPAAPCLGGIHNGVLFAHVVSHLSSTPPGSCHSLGPPKGAASMGTSRERTLEHAKVTACYRVSAVCAVTWAWLCGFPRYTCLHRREWLCEVRGTKIDMGWWYIAGNFSLWVRSWQHWTCHWRVSVQRMCYHRYMIKGKVISVLD